MLKRGELTTQQLIGLIILIASFAVILFLLFRLNFGETSDAEICHNSVVLQGQSKLAGNIDCRTNYVCVSGGGNCNEFNSKTTISAQTEKDISDAIDKEIKNCDWMFGEGKIDYVGYSWKIDYLVGINCAICSIVKFDEDIQNDFPKVVFKDKEILTSEKYAVVTGMEEENKYIEPQIIKSGDIDSLGCDYFITKA